VVEGGKSAKAELSDKQWQQLLHKSFFLRHAYLVALFQMGKYRRWGGICKEIIEDANRMGIKTYTCISSFQEMNRDF
jgi:hypothetical protein